MTTNPPAASDGQALTSAEELTIRRLQVVVKAGFAPRPDTMHVRDVRDALALIDRLQHAPPASRAGVREAIAMLESLSPDELAYVRLTEPARQLRAALESAIPTAEPEPAIPAGMVLVPREPTEAMIEAGHEEWLRMHKETGYHLGLQHANVFKAMLNEHLDSQRRRDALCRMVELDEEIEAAAPAAFDGGKDD